MWCCTIWSCICICQLKLFLSSRRRSCNPAAGSDSGWVSLDLIEKAKETGISGLCKCSRLSVGTSSHGKTDLSAEAAAEQSAKM